METIGEARELEYAAMQELNAVYRNANYSDPAWVAKRDEIQARRDAITAEAISKFAKPQVADCGTCQRNSIFGGHGHYASPRCRSGRHPHCTCDTCF